MSYRFLRWISMAFLLNLAIVADRPDTARVPDFRIDSELVVLPVSVSDRMGRSMLGLSTADFAVAEDCVPQQVLAVYSWDAPASIFLM